MDTAFEQARADLLLERLTVRNLTKDLTNAYKSKDFDLWLCVVAKNELKRREADIETGVKLAFDLFGSHHMEELKALFPAQTKS